MSLTHDQLQETNQSSASVSETMQDEDAEFRTDWLALSAAGLARAYGDDEPEYDTGMIKEPNPKYRDRE